MIFDLTEQDLIDISTSNININLKKKLLLFIDKALTDATTVARMEEFKCLTSPSQENSNIMRFISYCMYENDIIIPIKQK